MYRRLALGFGFSPIGDAPVRLSARVATVELSARPLSKPGRWLAILAFEVPFVPEPSPGMKQ